MLAQPVANSYNVTSLFPSPNLLLPTINQMGLSLQSHWFELVPQDHIHFVPYGTILSIVLLTAHRHAYAPLAFREPSSASLTRASSIIIKKAMLRHSRPTAL